MIFNDQMATRLKKKTRLNDPSMIYSDMKIATFTSQNIGRMHAKR